MSAAARARVAPAILRALCERLAHDCGPSLELRDDAAARDAFSRDESGLDDFPPDLVVAPSTTAEVSAVVRACQELGVPVVPVGARTGKSGGSLAVYGGVALSFERMNRILEVHEGDFVAVAQPGVRLSVLVQAVEARGLFYPVDPGSIDSCTLGGNVAENAGGPRALKYGVTRDYVLALEWVLPAGEVLRVGHRTHKGVAGYDLTALFVGSEGTLGVATEITLRLLPRPRATRTALVSFPTVTQAAEAVGEILRSGCLPCALELLDDLALSAVARAGLAMPLHEAAGAALLIELDGGSDDALLQELGAAVERCEAAGATEARVASDAAQREALWRVRRGVSPALRALRGRKLSEDVVVPRSRIPEAIAAFKALGARLGLEVATYGHAGDGNLHANVLFERAEQLPLVDLALDELMRTTLALGGTITGEHGVGLTKRRFLGLEHTPELQALERRLRVTFDPRRLQNPGKIHEGF